MNDKKEEIKQTEVGKKKNLWKIIIILVLIIAVFRSCGNTCKEKGCHDEFYKGGYCRTHYMLHITNEYLDDYFN